MPETARRSTLPGIIGPMVLAGGLVGALLLFVAEFTPLYDVRTQNGGHTVRSVSAGSHHDFAMALIAIVAAALAVGAWRYGGRPALLAVGLLGLLALLISLLGDLPDARASGLYGTPTTHFQLASASPSAGMYMETLGAVLLIITCASAFILLGPPRRVGAGARPSGSNG